MDSIEIFFLIVISFFALIVSILTVNSIRRTFDWMPKLIRPIWISIQSLFIIGTAFYSINKIEAPNNTELIIKKHKPYIESEEEKKLKIEQIKALEEKHKQEELIKYIHSYYDAYCDFDYVRLDNFYVYPMERYFTFANASKSKVHNRINFERLHPNWDICKLSDDKNIIITTIGKDTLEISIPLKKKKNSVYFTTMCINKQMRIYSIMNTIRTPDNSEPK